MATKYYSGTFNAPWGTSLLWISWGVTAGFVLTILVTWMKAGPAAWLVTVIFSATLFITALFTVKGYELKDQTLYIQRLFWKSKVDLSHLESAEVAPDVFKKAFKTMGNGGLFSFSGYFWSRSTGKFRCYVTDVKRSVVLVIDGKKIVVSPDSPEGFVRALKV